MSDEKEEKMHITPETPEQLMVQNPFESPSDYSHLQEQIFSSPTVFKTSNSSVTPGKFRWSIDKLALINPVEIDSEDIRRQALYLSQARIDKEMEEKRQKAIEEFFTKGVIVPSPWTDPSGKQVSQHNSTFDIDPNNASSIGRVVAVQPGKSNAACQTALSLPLDFDVEKILGEYFKTDELADQSQESMSTSSLRRKLFLDENGSLSSENSSPAFHSPHNVPASLGVLYSTDISPVRCSSTLNTPSSGQFSSSPIQGGMRTYSLGSVTSPSFPERDPAFTASPTFSPIGIQIRKMPLSEQRHFTFRSPDMPSASNSCQPAPPFSVSPYSECSPLKNGSPMRTVACRGATVYQTSLICLPSTPEGSSENQPEVEEASDVAEENPSSAEAKVNLHPLNGDASTRGTHLVVAQVSISPEHSEGNKQGLTLIHDLDSFKENDLVDMEDPGMLEEDDGMPIAGLNFEGSCICMSPLFESSASPCENSSLQHGETIPRYWTENEPVHQSSSSCLLGMLPSK